MTSFMSQSGRCLGDVMEVTGITLCFFGRQIRLDVWWIFWEGMEEAVAGIVFFSHAGSLRWNPIQDTVSVFWGCWWGDFFGLSGFLFGSFLSRLGGGKTAFYKNCTVLRSDNFDFCRLKCQKTAENPQQKVADFRSWEMTISRLNCL